MKIHQLTIGELLASVHSNMQGLTTEEANRRLLEFGSNIINKAKRETTASRFFKGFTHFFAIILWCGSAFAFLGEWMQPGGGMAMLGWAILGVIVINALFSFWQEFRAEQAISALEKLIPHQVKVLRDGKLTQLPSAALVPGDVISIEEGDNVPADCRLLEGFGVRVNNATLTGESVPLSRDASVSEQDDLKNSKNVLLAGTSVFAGQGKAVVFHTGMHTEFGKIAGLTQEIVPGLSPLQKEISRLSRVIAAIAVSMGLLLFLVGQLIGMSLLDDFVLALGIIVALVPEGLLPEVTLVLATCSQRMAKRNALIRHLPSVETLGCATVICTDKTGTLTQNKMSCKRMFLFDGFTEQADMRNPGQQRAAQMLSRISLGCNNVKNSMEENQERLLGDPMEIALVEFAQQSSASEPAAVRIDEVPFDSDRKRLSTIHRIEGRKILYTKGAAELLLPLCTRVCTAGSDQLLSDSQRIDFLAANDTMTSNGLRVLAFAYRELPEGGDLSPADLESDLTLAGLIGLQDPPRPEVSGALDKCRGAGIRVIMITGDHPNTALSIAREIGLVTSNQATVITGEQLKRLSDTQLQLLLSTQELIFARADADQKLRVVRALKRKGEIVAVTGDGVNDAPALRAADIGVAMGITGTDVAREAADMILTDDNFASIVNAIEEGRAVFSNIRKFLTYVLSSNVAEMVPCLAFVLFRVPLPLTVIQILSVDLGTDLLPALALGAETPDKSLMTEPPRSRKDALFDIGLMLRAYLFLGAMVSAASMAAYFYLLNSGGWQWGQHLAPTDPLYKLATTGCLIGIVCMQIVNSSMCRSETRSVFSMGVFSNRFLLLSVLSEVVLIACTTYTPFGHAVFGTASLPVSFWLFMLPFMATMFLVEELRKWLMSGTAARRLNDTRSIESSAMV